MAVLTLYDMVAEAREAAPAFSGRAVQQVVLLDEKSKPSTTRKMWFLLEPAGPLTVGSAKDSE